MGKAQKRRTRKHRRLSKARIRTGTDGGVRHNSPSGRNGQIHYKNLKGRRKPPYTPPSD